MRSLAGAADGVPKLVEADRPQPNSFVMTLGNLALAVLHLPFPIPAESLAPAVGSELLWRGAGEAFAAADGHVILAVLTPPRLHADLVRQSRALTFAAAAVLSTMGGHGVFWLPGDHVVEPDRFRREAALLGRSDFASPLWFSFHFFPGSADPGDSALVCRSAGLKPFLGREVECGPYRMAPQALAETVLFVARYMASAGPVFADGHTLGFGDGGGRDARLSLVVSRHGGGAQPVFRLELSAADGVAA
jgi:hypothetical protein